MGEWERERRKGDGEKEKWLDDKEWQKYKKKVDIKNGERGKWRRDEGKKKWQEHGRKCREEEEEEEEERERERERKREQWGKSKAI